MSIYLCLPIRPRARLPALDWGMQFPDNSGSLQENWFVYLAVGLVGPSIQTPACFTKVRCVQWHVSDKYVRPRVRPSYHRQICSLPSVWWRYSRHQIQHRPGERCGHHRNPVKFKVQYLSNATTYTDSSLPTLLKGPFTFEPRHVKTTNPPSLISVFAVRMKKAWVLSYPLSAQRRLWSDWADAQADLSVRWAHNHFVGFVMSRLTLRGA